MIKKTYARVVISLLLFVPIFAFAQGTHTSRVDRCVRNCDMNYKNCLAKKKKATYCSEKRRACRTTCIKQHK
ncbi:MAG: hypothetical protein N2316_00270 [Spirochaetes bacterium]|nr:hypothetical protein [Spirochaetota bacterium]